MLASERAASAVQSPLYGVCRSAHFFLCVTRELHGQPAWGSASSRAWPCGSQGSHSCGRCATAFRLNEAAEPWRGAVVPCETIGMVLHQILTAKRGTVIHRWTDLVRGKL